MCDSDDVARCVNDAGLEQPVFVAVYWAKFNCPPWNARRVTRLDPAPPS